MAVAVSVVVMSSLLAGCAGPNGTPVYRPQSDETLCVMTYNLRYAAASGPNNWPARRPVMREAIRSIGPDLMGTQEGVYHQLKELAADLPEYQWLGTGRDGGSRGEFMAIFYRPDRLEPLEYDHFWLSDTPNVIASSTWGNTCRRMCTWVRFRDRKTGQQFYFFNTHLDHEVQAAREKGIALICQRIAALKTELPVILGGDFNADARANKAYELAMEAGLADAWYTAAKRIGREDLASFNGFKEAKPGPHIDWVLTRGDVMVEAAHMPVFQSNGQFPSDHFPIVTWVRLGKARPHGALDRAGAGL